MFIRRKEIWSAFWMGCGSQDSESDRFAFAGSRCRPPLLHEARLAEFAKDKKIPVNSGWSEFAESGGLLTHGPNSRKFFRRLGGYVHKIVTGTKPVEIPIEQPATFELVINLNTAKSIGLTIPPTRLGRADTVIE